MEKQGWLRMEMANTDMITNYKFENFRLNFSCCGIRDGTPMNNFNI